MNRKPRQKPGAYAPFADPAQKAAEARPVWSPDVGAAVLRARAEAVLADIPDRELRSVLDLPGAVHLLIDDRERSHLLMVSGCNTLQLMIEGADVLAGPVRLTVLIPGLAAIGPALPKLLMLRRMVSHTAGPIMRSGHWTPQAIALRDALIALDGHSAGASHREVAAIISGQHRVARDWPDPSLKDRARRALRRGRAYACGQYRKLIV